MKRYTYEFEAFPCEDMYCVFPHGLEGATQGEDLADAIAMAADWLRMEAEEAAMRGKELPEPVFGAPLEHGGERIVVSVVAGRDTVDAVSAKRAAEILGVSKKRVAAMYEQALLDGWRCEESGKLHVSMGSIIARLQDRRL